MGTLFVVATPIGNLGDISDRVISTLKESDIIFAEDTRVTKKITSHFEIDTKVLRYNEHKPEKTFKKVRSFLEKSKSISLVSDSGTPGISDPGGKLVNFVRSEVNGTKIRVVPGPSAVVAALSASGLPASEFSFLGFPPAKRKRNKFFKRVGKIDVRPVVIYESTHRLQKTFDGLEDQLGDIEIFVAKEMTKVYEDYFIGFISDAREYFKGKKGKGEFVIIIP